jgi:hypothetical protein
MANKWTDCVFTLYPTVVTMHSKDGKNYTCKDKDNKDVTIDYNLVDAEFAKIEYKNKRLEEYPDWGTQLDYIYHNGIDKWKTDIVDPVKAKYPKP